MPDNAYSVLTGARVVVPKGGGGRTQTDLLRPLHFARSDFVLDDGRVIFVLDGFLEGPRSQPCLHVLKGKQVSNDGKDPFQRYVSDAEADIRDKSFELSETVNLERGLVVPPYRPGSIEGAPRQPRHTGDTSLV
jgi:hypothetical protein